MTAKILAFPKRYEFLVNFSNLDDLRNHKSGVIEAWSNHDAIQSWINARPETVVHTVSKFWQIRDKNTQRDERTGLGM